MKELNYVLISFYIFITTFSKLTVLVADSSDYRLPNTIIPTNYDISFIIHPEEDDFAGTVNIKFDVSSENDTINEIYLHTDADYITINSLSVNDDTSCTFSISEDSQILKATCSNKISGNDNFVYIEFSGKYSTEDGLGLVKSNYTYNDKEYIYIGSYFKPIYARRAFPCLDEPELKASFTVDVTYPNDYSVISNSPIEEVIGLRTDVKTTIFKPIPRISTYLLSILVSKFEEAYIPNVTEDDYDFKVFTRRELGDSARTIAGSYYNKILDKLEDYTGVPYQNLSETACYHVAIPDYLDGMGDFGLFSYRESDILDEGEKTTNRVKQNILINMAYKLSHQWYGGDISTKWWSDIWANEAVTAYLGYAIADEVEEEFELKNQFVVEVIQKVMQYDAMQFAKPLSYNESRIYIPSKIQEQLDILSYYKGANVLHMANYVLTSNGGSLKESLQNYWNDQVHLNANGTKLLEIFGSQGQLFRVMNFESWVYLPGFPLLTVKVENITEDNVEILNLTETRFIYPITEETAFNETLWNIPLTFTHEYLANFSSVDIDIIMTPDDEFKYFIGCTDWQLFNVLESGIYRVNYDDELWGRLIKALKDDTEREVIHAINKAQLVDDIFNIARIGEVSYSLAFELADYLKDENEYYPWFSALNAFSYLMGKLGDDEVEKKLENYVLSLLEHVITIPSGKLTDNNATHIDVLKNVLVLKWACDLEHEGCISYTTKKFNDYRQNPDSLEDYNLRELIFCNGIRYSENILDDWIYLFDVYTTSTSVHEQDDILNALGCMDNEIILQSYLEKIIYVDSGFKKQDILKVFKSVLLNNNWGLELVKEFLQNNYNTIVSMYKGNSIWPEMLYAVAEKLITFDELEWLSSIFSDPIFDDYLDILEKVVIIGSVNQLWVQRYQSNVAEILNEITLS